MPCAARSTSSGITRYDVGMTGLIGFSSGYYAMEDCDTLLMLGTISRIASSTPKAPRIAQIDLRAEVSATERRSSSA